MVVVFKAHKCCNRIKELLTIKISDIVAHQPPRRRGGRPYHFVWLGVRKNQKYPNKREHPHAPLERALTIVKGRQAGRLVDQSPFLPYRVPLERTDSGCETYQLANTH